MLGAIPMVACLMPSLGMCDDLRWAGRPPRFFLCLPGPPPSWVVRACMRLIDPLAGLLLKWVGMVSFHGAWL